MANMNPMDFVMSMIRQNPNIARNPNAQSMLEVIQNNDAEKGRQIAKNLCNSYGVSEEEMLSRAKQFFHIP